MKLGSKKVTITAGRDVEAEAEVEVAGQKDKGPKELVVMVFHRLFSIYSAFLAWFSLVFIISSSFCHRFPCFSLVFTGLRCSSMLFDRRS